MLKLLVNTSEWVHGLKERAKKDIEGASLIEYSLLIALIAAATIALIVSIGGKVTTAWTNLNNNWN